MFVLLGLFFTKGLEITVVEGEANISANIIVLIFLIYLMVYLVVLAIVNKKQGAPFLHLLSGLQVLKEADERESIVTMKASRTAYATTIITLPLALVAYVSAYTLIGFTGAGIEMYTVGCWIFILACIIVNISFSLSWCIEESR